MNNFLMEATGALFWLSPVLVPIFWAWVIYVVVKKLIKVWKEV